MSDIIFCKGGGCTAKLGAGVLGKILEKLPSGDDPDLLVGFGSSDDGAVYRINNRQALIDGRGSVPFRSYCRCKCYE